MRFFFQFPSARDAVRARYTRVAFKQGYQYHSQDRLPFISLIVNPFHPPVRNDQKKKKSNISDKKKICQRFGSVRLWLLDL